MQVQGGAVKVVVEGRLPVPEPGRTRDGRRGGGGWGESNRAEDSREESMKKEKVAKQGVRPKKENQLGVPTSGPEPGRSRFSLIHWFKWGEKIPHLMLNRF